MTFTGIIESVCVWGGAPLFTVVWPLLLFAAFKKLLCIYRSTSHTSIGGHATMNLSRGSKERGKRDIRMYNWSKSNESHSLYVIFVNVA